MPRGDAPDRYQTVTNRHKQDEISSLPGCREHSREQWPFPKPYPDMPEYATRPTACVCLAVKSSEQR